MTIYFGISYTGTVIGMTVTGITHTHGIMIPGIIIHGTTIPGIMTHGIMDLITTTRTIMAMVRLITTATPHT